MARGLSRGIRTALGVKSGTPWWQRKPKKPRRHASHASHASHLHKLAPTLRPVVGPPPGWHHGQVGTRGRGY